LVARFLYLFSFSKWRLLLRATVSAAFLGLALLWAMPASAELNLFDLHPGMTLTELMAKPAPGSDLNKKRRYGCFNEPELKGKMAEVMETSVARETSLGIITCLVVQPDVLNKSSWAVARVAFEGAEGHLWLPFVTQPDGAPKLAMIAFYPFAKPDKAVLDRMIDTRLGAGAPAKRDVSSIVSGAVVDVRTWQQSGDTIDVMASDLYLYRPEFTKDLATRLKKIPGGSFFYAVPE
jgi:hypothetical protein